MTPKLSLEPQGHLLPPPLWRAVKDGDDLARAFFDGHYSRKRYADGRRPKLFVGPGEKLVLVTPCRRALFVWRKFIAADGQEGVNCAIFRNAGAGLSSFLIREADAIADERWPGALFFVDPPYWGIEGLYGKELFSRGDYERLRERLRGLAGGFILTLNDKSEVRDFFGEFAIEAVAFRYSLSRHHNDGKELIITNRPEALSAAIGPG